MTASSRVTGARWCWRRILSECGLREGHEYHTQVNIEVEKGKRYQPDVIVHLPQEKDIIIDAKVSLTAYERWYNAEDELEKAVALKEPRRLGA